MDWFGFMERASDWATVHFNELMLYGFGLAGIAFIIVAVFKGANGSWKVPFIRYKPKKR